jgi:hypothetical protein
MDVYVYVYVYVFTGLAEGPAAVRGGIGGLVVVAMAMCRLARKGQAAGPGGARTCAFRAEQLLVATDAGGDDADATGTETYCTVEYISTRSTRLACDAC